MEAINDEQVLHDWVVGHLKEKFSRIYSDIKINPGDTKDYEFSGYYPDVLFINYGQVTQIIEVETSSTVNQDRVDHWKELSGLGVKLVVLVPKNRHKNAMELCWSNGLAAKVKIGTYEFQIDM